MSKIPVKPKRKGIVDRGPKTGGVAKRSKIITPSVRRQYRINEGKTPKRLKNKMKK